MNASLQKASIWKRISAWLCDFIILAIVSVGLALALSAILGYDSYYQQMTDIENNYITEYDIEDPSLTLEEREKLPADVQERYNAAEKALAEDTKYIGLYYTAFYLILTIISMSLLISFVIFEFVLPLLFKNGQTVGKKVFGVAVMRTSSIKVTPVVVFIRAILGKYTIETMVPVLLIIMILNGVMGLAGLVTIGLILLFDLILICATKTRSAIHDVLSDCVVVDMASQMIFENEEAIIEYQKKIHAEDAKARDY